MFNGERSHFWMSGGFLLTKTVLFLVIFLFNWECCKKIETRIYEELIWMDTLSDTLIWMHSWSLYKFPCTYFRFKLMEFYKLPDESFVGSSETHLISRDAMPNGIWRGCGLNPQSSSLVRVLSYVLSGLHFETTRGIWTPFWKPTNRRSIT